MLPNSNIMSIYPVSQNRSTLESTFDGIINNDLKGDQNLTKDLQIYSMQTELQAEHVAEALLHVFNKASNFIKSITFGKQEASAEAKADDQTEHQKNKSIVIVLKKLMSKNFYPKTSIVDLDKKPKFVRQAFTAYQQLASLKDKVAADKDSETKRLLLIDINKHILELAAQMEFVPTHPIGKADKERQAKVANSKNGIAALERLRSLVEGNFVQDDKVNNENFKKFALANDLLLVEQAKSFKGDKKFKSLLQRVENLLAFNLRFVPIKDSAALATIGVTDSRAVAITKIIEAHNDYIVQRFQEGGAKRKDKAMDADKYSYIAAFVVNCNELLKNFNNNISLMTSVLQDTPFDKFAIELLARTLIVYFEIAKSDDGKYLKGIRKALKDGMSLKLRDGKNDNFALFMSNLEADNASLRRGDLIAKVREIHDIKPVAPVDEKDEEVQLEEHHGRTRPVSVAMAALMQPFTHAAPPPPHSAQPPANEGRPFSPSRPMRPPVHTPASGAVAAAPARAMSPGRAVPPPPPSRPMSPRGAVPVPPPPPPLPSTSSAGGVGGTSAAPVPGHAHKPSTASTASTASTSSSASRSVMSPPRLGRPLTLIQQLEQSHIGDAVRAASASPSSSASAAAAAPVHGRAPSTASTATAGSVASNASTAARTGSPLAGRPAHKLFADKSEEELKADLLRKRGAPAKFTKQN